MTDLRKAAQDVVDAAKFAIIPYFMKSEVDALRAALQSCPDCGKPTPPDSVHTCSPQVVPDVPYPGMQEAFESREKEKLESALRSMPVEEAEYHMNRCIASGLWNA